MTEPTDYTDPGEIFRKSMKEALDHLDKVTQDVTKAREEAVDLQIAAKEELRRLEREAEKISKSFIEKHSKEFEERIKKEILNSLAKRLILSGKKTDEILSLLDIPAPLVLQAQTEIGFTKLGTHLAHVAYEEQGRAGDIIFYRDDIMLRFWYEFAGGNTLAFVDVPTPEKWTAVTGLPVTDRLPVLQFIGERIIRDRAPGYHFEIKDSEITIS
jgi:hypothetical protein